MPIEITFLRTDDIPVLCAEGAIDMGITGGDLIDETGVQLTNRLAARHGQLAAGDLRARRQRHSQAGRPGRAAHRHELSASHQAAILRQHKVEAHIVELTGSVEVMIALGVADAIVDLVETGSTLAANRLTVLDELGRYEAVLMQNPATQHAQLADRVVRRLEGVVIARSYSLLEYNVPEAKLAEAEKITPGFESPTVNKLEEAGWFAVRAMVKRSEVIEIMERLEALGATAILETTITNCRL